MRISFREFLYASNLLSISRIFLIPPIYYCIKIDTRPGDLALLALLVLAILTDVLDGYLSRKLNQQTELGRILDPLADKIALIVLLAAGVMFRGFPKMLVLLLLFRDVVILVVGAIVSKRMGRIIEANVWGKLNSLVFCIAAFVFVAFPGTYAVTVTLLASYLLVFVSGISYYRLGEPHLVRGIKGRFLLRLLAVVLVILVVRVGAAIPLPGNVNCCDKPARSNLPAGTIARYAPVMYFNSEERFLPAAVESFLDAAVLKEKKQFRSDKVVATPGRAAEAVGKRSGKQYYLTRKSNRSRNGGSADPANSPGTAYAAAFEMELDGRRATVIQYWFFFSAGTPGMSGLLRHECGWEMMMVWLDGDLRPVKAGYSQRYYGEVRMWDNMQTEDGRPVVYVSRGSHAFYFEEGKHPAYFDNRKKIRLGSDVCDRGIRWSPAAEEIQRIDMSIPWVSFRGLWGSPTIIEMPGPAYRHPLNRDLAMWKNPGGWFQVYERIDR